MKLKIIGKTAHIVEVERIKYPEVLEFKYLIEEAIEEYDVDNIVIDLSHIYNGICSRAIGVMLANERQLQEKCNGGITLTGVNGYLARVFKNIHLSRVIKIEFAE